MHDADVPEIQDTLFSWHRVTCHAHLSQISQISTMKYKQHLTENIAPEYGPEPYLAYGELDDIIRQLSSKAPAR